MSLLRDSLLARDSILEERKLPCCTEEEIEGYIWDKAAPKVNPDGSQRKEEPLKLNDHGMDAMRYMVAYFDLRDPRDALIGQLLGVSFGGKTLLPNANPKEPNRYRNGQAEVLMPKWDVLG